MGRAISETSGSFSATLPRAFDRPNQPWWRTRMDKVEKRSDLDAARKPVSRRVAQAATGERTPFHRLNRPNAHASPPAHVLSERSNRCGVQHIGLSKSNLAWRAQNARRFLRDCRLGWKVSLQHPGATDDGIEDRIFVVQSVGILNLEGNVSDRAVLASSGQKLGRDVTTASIIAPVAS